MSRFATELLGTFFLAFVIGLTVLQGVAMAPLAIGATLIAMVYMGGHISGGHYNPAVTLAVYLRGKISFGDAVWYMMMQVTGAVLAALATHFVLDASLTIAPAATATTAQALLVEFLFTFALASVVLNVATSKDHPNNSFYGLAIGLTIVVAAFAGGSISGGAFNPAVAIGHNLVSGDITHLWLYLVGPLLGGVLAAGVFRVTNPDEFIHSDNKMQVDFVSAANEQMPLHKEDTVRPDLRM